ncbi:MAG: GrpB family protein [Proteobacteria bacterium]|nr:GrpB family protein [Pseudomonadota bacterium]
MKLLQPPEYQVQAEMAFAQESAAVLNLLPSARIEHVGSSSVPGAISKGDLDICVLVPADSHSLAVNVLEGAGYTIKTDTLRTHDLCMLESSRKDIHVALQVVSMGSKFEFFVIFRDRLRGNPHLVAEYNRVKIGAQHEDEDRYREAKSKFIERVLGEA